MSPNQMSIRAGVLADRIRRQALLRQNIYMTFTKMHNECWDLHYTLSAALTLAVAFFVNVLIAVCVVFAIGLLKELFDKYIRKVGFGVGDFIANILGIVSGAVVVLIAQAIKG